MNVTFDKIKPHLIALGIIILISAIYFSPALQGKKIQQDDSLAFKGAVQENLEYEKKEDRTILWTNSMFGGMPMYQIHPSSDGNYLIHFHKVFRLFLNGPIAIFIAAMLCMYLMLVLLGAEYRLSLIGAIAFGLTTNNVILWSAGHSTKLVALTYLALILGGFLLIFRRKYLLGALVFTIGLALELGANHIQMTYYFALCLIVLWLIKTIKGFIDGEASHIIKTNVILLVCTVLAVLTTSTNYLATFEYQKDTMRGDPILEKTSEVAKSSSETKGLEWEYAMNWSNGMGDVFAAIIPDIVGGGSSGETAKVTKGSALANLGLQVGSPNYSYSGKLPFTSGPIYFGAVMCFLFILGSIVVRGPVKWWLVFSVLFTIILSMGKFAPTLNEFLYNNIPMFNKFRAPNSVLGVTAFFLVTLGILALVEIFKNKKSNEELAKKVWIAAGITGGFCLLIAVMGDSFFPVDADIDAKILEQTKNQGFLDAIHEDRISLMKSDAWRSFFFIALAAGAIWAFAKGKLKATYAMIAVGLLVLIDLWGVDKRYINNDSFESNTKVNERFVMRPVDQQILQDTDLSYRVFDLAVNTFNNATTSYYHKTIGGYHAAKLQRYQDIIDYHISKSNTEVFNMLNTRYIITQEQQLQRNPEALGNAWFVEDIKKVASANEEINALEVSKGFKADSIAIVLDSEFDNYVGSFNPTKNGDIKLTSYIPDRLVYESNTNSEQFAVFSEIWYGPNKGWNAYLDGKLVPHIRVNYCLRGMKIPAGKHKVEFKFEPVSYTIGKTAAMISSILVLLLLAYGIVKLVKTKEDEIVVKDE